MTIPHSFIPSSLSSKAHGETKGAMGSELDIGVLAELRCLFAVK